MSRDFGPQIQRLETILNEASSRFTMWMFEQSIFLEQIKKSAKGGSLEWAMRDSWRDIPKAISIARRNAEQVCKYAAMLRQDSPHYMGKGTHQLVLRVDDGWVAKTVYYREWRGLYALGYGITCYREAMMETIDFFQEQFGFEIPYRIVQCTSSKNGIQSTGAEWGKFMILEDHTKNGRYIIKDVEDVDLDELNNGAHVRDVLQGYVDRLVEAYRERKQDPHSKLKAHIGHHQEKEDIVPELTKAFFLKIDPNTGNADVVPGDFDHVSFYTSRD